MGYGLALYSMAIALAVVHAGCFRNDVENNRNSISNAHGRKTEVINWVEPERHLRAIIRKEFVSDLITGGPVSFEWCPLLGEPDMGNCQVHGIIDITFIDGTRFQWPSDLAANKVIYCSGKECLRVIEWPTAQQVDSAEASTIAVPPSKPSGSPR